ncbi:hypothetical protein GKG47_09290 [Lactonifactor sp. BIOML-A3]|uniref:hypothetical protein n=1 Tax=unclassified Lactonifactor TaxID=2636670 RepID=UPI0012AFE0F6|nr:MULTISPECIES: hypothetical protein [unclassified Lactonifactor]MSA02231.1 hypothetical protein [Lactonifactor sp. BIOML-A5]MSA08015.1 hypothetical protein [Lactonifactor sp. BIOML-A4]MSA12631.1 hypothetical protein [Lactonifactor sp. BIOML-A3]MSA16667.1 hypothetical protein [Lactonifactor sp. BIOML-A2]MSA37634.1 hypothetical protein [Lactonifactor sp. BIOML-A1]
MHHLACDELEMLIEDLKSNSAVGNNYLDTWDYEDDYSHNEIDKARDDFLEAANDYLSKNNYPYIMREVCENARLCDKDTGEILRG